MTETAAFPAGQASTDAERADLLETLGKHRFFLRLTVRELTDEQARLRPTASQLCLGGLIKHVTLCERQWTDFIAGRESGMAGDRPEDFEAHAQSFEMLPDETLDELLAAYERIAAHTTELISTLPDLAVSRPLPAAPWFEPGAQWSARRVFLHILAETAQHAGHADIIRESIDGAKSMG